MGERRLLRLLEQQRDGIRGLGHIMIIMTVFGTVNNSSETSCEHTAGHEMDFDLEIS